MKKEKVDSLKNKLCCDKTDSIMLDKLVLLENHYVLRILKYVGAGASFFWVTSHLVYIIERVKILLQTSFWKGLFLAFDVD